MSALVWRERRSTLPAVWVQVPGTRMCSAAETAHELLVGVPAARPMSAGASRLPLSYQVQRRAPQAPAQAQTVRTVRTAASFGTTESKQINGFRGYGVATKQLVGDVSGVPPRGRPV